jgi:hypothetical protein
MNNNHYAYFVDTVHRWYIDSTKYKPTSANENNIDPIIDLLDEDQLKSKLLTNINEFANSFEHNTLKTNEIEHKINLLLELLKDDKVRLITLKKMCSAKAEHIFVAINNYTVNELYTKAFEE